MVIGTITAGTGQRGLPASTPWLALGVALLETGVAGGQSAGDRGRLRRRSSRRSQRPLGRRRDASLHVV